jgi:hypothetical protein
MILERHKYRFKSHAARPLQVKRHVEHVDPENALGALEILGIASRSPDTVVDNNGNGLLRLERWAVEAALRRRSFDGLSSSDKHLISNFTHESAVIKWPRGWLDDDRGR